jgi:hypothetical protein
MQTILNLITFFSTFKEYNSEADIQANRALNLQG